jgi:hypothetical protein
MSIARFPELPIAMLATVAITIKHYQERSPNPPVLKHIFSVYFWPTCKKTCNKMKRMQNKIDRSSFFNTWALFLSVKCIPADAPTKKRQQTKFKCYVQSKTESHTGQPLGSPPNTPTTHHIESNSNSWDTHSKGGHTTYSGKLRRIKRRNWEVSTTKSPWTWGWGTGRYFVVDFEAVHWAGNLDFSCSCPGQLNNANLLT